MNSQILSCSMCGHLFDAYGQSACSSCPVQKGCQLVCCPNCGYETVNIHQSVFARFAARFLPKEKDSKSGFGVNLVDLSPGSQARVIDFGISIPLDRKAHLQAYGLIPGNCVRIVQHSPVTIIQIDHTELALENSLARLILVEPVILD